MSPRPRDTTKEARTVTRYLRISPRKMRLVIDTIRFQPIGQAFLALMGLKKKAARMVERSLKSAVANAKVKGLAENRLLVSEVRADGGPVMKRFMARAMGRANPILKRTTHLTIIVREGERSFGPPPPSNPESAKSQKLQKPKKKEKAAA